MSIAKSCCLVAFVGLAVGVSAASPPPRATEAERAAPSLVRLESDGLQASPRSAYVPPTCVPGVPFADITCSTPYDAWIEQFGRDEITAGCGGGDYCPDRAVTRNQMAVFIERAMRGTGSWPAHVAYAWAVKDADGSPDPAASGDALLAALASIPSSGNDAPSADNPWLLKVGPGIFDLGTYPASLPAYVSMIGSGIDATIVRGSGVNLIECWGGGEVASLSAIRAGTGTQAVGLFLLNWMDITHVRVQVSGASQSNTAVYVMTGPPTHLTDVDLTATGGTLARGLDVNEGTVVIRGGTLTASGGSSESFGLRVHTGIAKVFDTLLDATTPVSGDPGPIYLAGCQLGSGSVGPIVTCAGVYDMSFNFYASTCP